MMKLLLIALLSFFSLTAMATCDEMREKIETKLKSKGVKYYSIEIRPIKNVVENAADADKEKPKSKGGKVVGTCDNESKEIVYSKL